ncbi:MAG: YCII-related protein [Flavipsychrobacter sp.]|nr:YCII-related protein [Flavipsychrobacter sp.]
MVFINFISTAKFDTMRDYMFVFRTDYNAIPERTAEAAAAMTQRWMDWIGGIAAQGKLTDRGNRLENTGSVVKGKNVVTNGPYAEIKESIGGYTIVKANSYDEAIEMAKGCPIFSQGGNVEVREVSIL